MNLDLAVPVIEIQLSDPEAVTAASSQRLADVLTEIERAESVATALQAFGAAAARDGQLKTARNGLGIKGKELIEAILVGHRQVEDSLLANYSGEGSADIGAAIEALLRLETEYGAVSKVLRRLSEHLLPVASIEMTLAESGLLFARSDELARFANARFAATTEMLRAAADHESGLTIDIRGSFSGGLLGCAKELRRQAQEKLRAADNAKRQYEETAAKIAAA